MAVVAIVFAALYGNAVRETSSAALKTVAATNVGEQLTALPTAEMPDVQAARTIAKICARLQNENP